MSLSPTVLHGHDQSGAWSALPKNPDRATQYWDETNRRAVIFDEDTGLWLSVDGGAIFRTTPLVTSDDFLNSVINGSWDLAKGSNGSTAHFAVVSGAPGAVKGTTGAAGDTVAHDAVQICGPLSYDIANGEINFCARVKFSAVTNLAFFIGLTDTLGSTTLEMPFTLSVVTYTANADNAVGFLFDTAATTDTVRCVAVNATVKQTPVASSDALVADTYRLFRIRVGTDGTARFYIDGTLIGSITTAVPSGTSLCPVVVAVPRSAATKDVTIDLLGARIVA